MRYCDVCQEERDYAVYERRMHGYINGRRVEYIGLKAYCKMCGAEILVPQLAELNEHFLLQAYKKPVVSQSYMRYNGQ